MRYDGSLNSWEWISGSYIPADAWNRNAIRRAKFEREKEMSIIYRDNVIGTRRADFFC